MRKTKMICTIGPASESPEILQQIIEAGMNVSRHNFSHGDHEEHAARINLVKELAKKNNKQIAVMRSLPLLQVIAIPRMILQMITNPNKINCKP